MNKIQIMIDNITESIGNFLSYVLFLMVTLIVISILLRFIFNIGNIAIQELIMYLHALLFMFGISYAYKEDSHVKIDILSNNISPKNSQILSIIGFIFFVMPFAIFLIYISTDMTMRSWSILEGSSEAGGLDLVFVLKTIIPLTGILILLQGISKLLKNIESLKNEC